MNKAKAEYLNISQLRPFEGHPFQVKEDEEMGVGFSQEWDQDILRSLGIKDVPPKRSTPTSNKYINSENPPSPAEQLLEYSKCGDFKSDGCLKSFTSMCALINDGETINSILRRINTTIKDNSNCLHE